MVHQRTGLPLFMRYVPGNVVDASTVRRTLLELEGMGINVSFALLDAGYYNGKNADALYEAGVPFVTRVCWIVGIGDLENIHYSRVSSAPMNL